MNPTIQMTLRAGIYAVVILAGGGCAEPRVASLPPVGPVPGPGVAAGTSPTGYLIVYTAWVQPKMFPDTMYAPHTGYVIYDRHGAYVRTVRNHLGAWDETPDLVALAPGNYTVAAQTESGIDLRVPVTVRRSRTTVVDLQWRDRHLVNL